VYVVLSCRFLQPHKIRSLPRCWRPASDSCLSKNITGTSSIAMLISFIHCSFKTSTKFISFVIAGMMLSRSLFNCGRLASVPKGLSGSPQMVACCQFSTSNRKQRLRARQLKFSARNKSLYDESALPVFADLMRKIYLRSHPDLLRSTSTEKAAINDTSMQSLNGVLSLCKTIKEFPANTDKFIPFYVKIDGEFQYVELKLKTGGGDCRHQLALCFEDFFHKTGVNSGKFTWGKDYFQEAGEDADEGEAKQSA
jgi:hypothetical protein